LKNFESDTCEIRQNQVHGVPLKKESELKHQGDFHSLSDGIVHLIQFHNSKVVMMATNFDTIEPFHAVSCRSKSLPAGTTINIPNAFYNYNQFMGSVDLTNLFIADYNISITGKKWYWAIFKQCLCIMHVAAWQLSIHAHYGMSSADQLLFLRCIIQDMTTLSC
jgi:hypothetical protein